MSQNKIFCGGGYYIEIMNFATLMTLLRVAVAPVFAYLFVSGYNAADGGAKLIYVCVALAAVIELSDLFDGMIARATNSVTDFGKVFDPVADSVSRQTVFISFMITGIIPLWMYLIFFYRDAFMQLLRIVCASNGIVLAARTSGKIKAVLQGVATFAVLGIVIAIKHGASWMPQILWGQHPAYWIMLVTAIYTVLSVTDYVIPYRKQIGWMMGKR